MNVSVNKQLMSYQNCFVVLSRTCHINGLKTVFSFQFHRRCPPAKLLSGPAIVCVCVCVCVCLLTSLTSSVVAHIEEGPSRSLCVCACVRACVRERERERSAGLLRKYPGRDET